MDTQGITRTAISGWHHDYKKAILRKKMINGQPIEILNIKKGQHESYKLDWKHLEKTKISTFFPAQWTRDHVMQKINEALNYIDKKKIQFKPQKGTSYTIAKGFTKEGIELRIIKNSENKIVTVFPEIR